LIQSTQFFLSLSRKAKQDRRQTRVIEINHCSRVSLIMLKLNRRTYLINKPFQFRMIIASLMLTLPTVALFYVAYQRLIKTLLVRLDGIDQSIAEPILELISQIESEIKLTIILGTIAIIILNAIFFLFLSHAIAGPIEKLKGFLQSKIDRVPTGPFRTRTTDFFSELPDLVNGALPEEPRQKTQGE
jgi:hypothetical protein